MGLAIIIPRDDLDDIRLHVLDGLLPAVLPQCIGKFDPVIGAPELFELRRADTHDEGTAATAVNGALVREVSVRRQKRIGVRGPTQVNISYQRAPQRMRTRRTKTTSS